MLNTKLILLIVIAIFPLTNNLMVKTEGIKPICFKKDIKMNDGIRVSFAVSAETKKTIDVVLTHLPTKTIIYNMYDKEMGKYDSFDIEKAKKGSVQEEIRKIKAGFYELCFKPRDSAKRFITFSFTTIFESGVQIDYNSAKMAEISKDEDIKGTLKDVLEIKRKFDEMENNNKQLLDRRRTHLAIFHSIYSSIRLMNLIKFFIIVGMTVFQIYVIKNYFGEEKRVTKLNGVNKEEL